MHMATFLDRLRTGYQAARAAGTTSSSALGTEQKSGWSASWPNPALLNAFGAYSNNTGVSVTPHSALQASAVAACVKVLSEDVAKLPVRIRRAQHSTGKTNWIDENSHLLNRLFRYPNSWQTMFEFLSMVVVSQQLWGNAYVAEEMKEETKLVIEDVYGDQSREHWTPVDVAEERIGDLSHDCVLLLERLEYELKQLSELRDPVDRFMAAFVREARHVLHTEDELTIAHFFIPKHSEKFDPDEHMGRYRAFTGVMRTLKKLMIMFHYMPDVLVGGSRTLTLLKTNGSMDFAFPERFTDPLG